ncbi:MAG: response regulator [Hyphomonadaceae bacterium]|nr:response regulator [Hyphomonadaceae bacterium]
MVSVLVAEDHPDNRDLIERRLMRAGYAVRLACDGAEAVRMATAQRPDIILMDLAMPVMGGMEAMRILRETPGFESLPIIALTAHAMDSARADCLAAGFTAFAAKPVDFKLLFELLSAHAPRAQSL